MAAKSCALKHQFYLSPFLWLGICLLLNNSLTAQSVELAYRNYSIDDGLPSSECYEIIQDSKGYVWISTDNGVSRFDGDHFTNYGPEQGLMDKTILFMHEDHRGWIWMSTLSGNCYIYRADTIAAYEYNSYLINKRKEYSLIHDFIIDTNGDAHFSLSDHSIFKISENGDTSSWKKHRTGSELGFYVREGKVLQLTQRNFHLPLSTEVKKIALNDPSFPNIADLKISKKGQRQSSKLGAFVFLIGEHFFLQYYDILYLFDKEYKSLKKVPFHKGSINCMYQLESGQILIGLFDSRGLIIYDSIESLFNGDSGEVFFTGNTISHITQINDGSIWVSSIENGIYHIPSLSVKVYHFDIGKANFATAVSNKADEVYFSVANGQIFKQSESTGWQELPTVEGLFRLDNFKYFDKEKIFVFNSPFTYWSTPVDDHTQAIHPHFNTIFTGFVDHYADEIACFNPLGIFYMDQTDGEVSLREAKKLNFSAVTCAVQTHPDTIWVGKRAGLYLLTEGSNMQKISGFSNLLDVNIRCLKTYQDGSLLIGTKNYGLLLLKNGALAQVSKQQGLLDNTIDKIRIDAKGHIWVTSKKGLNRLTYQEDSLYIHTISTLNGLPSNEVIDVTFSKKTTWVVGKQWITAFPANYEFDYHPLQVKVNKIQVDEKEQSLKSDITLDWNNTLLLHFTAFNFHAFNNQSYRYRLQPNDDWIAINQSVINLSNLAPDKYQCEIQAKQNDGIWSASTALSIHVLPPYWQRWWFIGIAIFSAAYIAYYLFNQRILKLKQERKQMELEEEINQFKQKAYQAQMNPHFVFNCLNAIQGYIIGGENDQKKAAHFLVRFSDLMRQALNYFRQESISISEEIKLLDNYLSLEQMRFNHKFEYSIQLDPTLESDWLQIPPLLVQPYVENAVLHGVASLKKKGIIRLSYRMLNKETLEVSIHDNGPGISYTKSLKQQHEKMHRASVGMTIAQKRLEIISLRANNIEITEPKAPDGSVSGTLVKVQIPLNY